jgi:hypothetical protein
MKKKIKLPIQFEKIVKKNTNLNIESLNFRKSKNQNKLIRINNLYKPTTI